MNTRFCFPPSPAAYETTPSRPHLALFTCLFLLMSFLGVAMYCTDRRRPQRVCEELEASLAVYLLHMKQLLWGCWIWLTMQWLCPATGGDTEPLFHFDFLVFFRHLFFPISEGAQALKHLSHLTRLCTLSVVLRHSHSEEGKRVIPEICSFHVCMYICSKVADMPLHIFKLWWHLVHCDVDAHV